MEKFPNREFNPETWLKLTMLHQLSYPGQIYRTQFTDTN